MAAQISFGGEDMQPRPTATDNLHPIYKCLQAVLQDHNYGAPPPTSPLCFSSSQREHTLIDTGTNVHSTKHARVFSPPAAHHLAEEDRESVKSNMSDGVHIDDDVHGEDTETASEGEGDEEAVTRCICGYEHDDGYMICCDICFVWQHVECMGVDRNHIPDTYLCDRCNPRRLDRLAAKTYQRKKLDELKRLASNSAQVNISRPSISRQDDRAVINKSTKVITKKGSWCNKSRSGSSSPPDRFGNEIAGSRAIVNMRRNPLSWKKRGRRKVRSESDRTSLRMWIDNYEHAVTNHYSPELRARLTSIGKRHDMRPPHLLSNLEANCTSIPIGGGKILIATTETHPAHPIIELMGKFMLSSQHRHATSALLCSSSRQITQRPGPFVFFYRMPKEGTDICIDTRTYGNIARFIRRSCRPNCELKHWFEKGTLHVYIQAINMIPSSTEITLRHEFGWHGLGIGRTPSNPCACNSPECLLTQTQQRKVEGTKIQRFTERIRLSPLERPLVHLPSNTSSAQTTKSPSLKFVARRNINHPYNRTMSLPLTFSEDETAKVMDVSDNEDSTKKSSTNDILVQHMSTPSVIAYNRLISSDIAYAQPPVSNKRTRGSNPATPGGKSVPPRRSSQLPKTSLTPDKTSPATESPSYAKTGDTNKMTREERKIAAVMKVFEHLERDKVRRDQFVTKCQRKEGDDHSTQDDNTDHEQHEVNKRRRRGRGRSKGTTPRSSRKKSSSCHEDDTPQAIHRNDEVPSAGNLEMCQPNQQIQSCDNEQDTEKKDTIDCSDGSNKTMSPPKTQATTLTPEPPSIAVTPSVITRNSVIQEAKTKVIAKPSQRKLAQGKVRNNVTVTTKLKTRVLRSNSPLIKDKVITKDKKLLKPLKLKPKSVVKKPNVLKVKALKSKENLKLCIEAQPRRKSARKGKVHVDVVQAASSVSAGSHVNEAAGLLLALSQSQPAALEQSPEACVPLSSPMSEMCQLVEAAVAPLETSLKFPSTKDIVNRWMMKAHAQDVSDINIECHSPSQSFNANQQSADLPIREILPVQLNINTSPQLLDTLVQAASTICSPYSNQVDYLSESDKSIVKHELKMVEDSPTDNSVNSGSAKKRWLHQALKEELDHYPFKQRFKNIDCGYIPVDIENIKSEQESIPKTNIKTNVIVSTGMLKSDVPVFSTDTNNPVNISNRITAISDSTDSVSIRSAVKSEIEDMNLADLFHHANKHLCKALDMETETPSPSQSFKDIKSKIQFFTEPNTSNVKPFFDTDKPHHFSSFGTKSCDQSMPTVQKLSFAEFNHFASEAHLLVKAKGTEEYLANVKEACVDMPTVTKPSPVELNRLALKIEETKDFLVDEKQVCINLSTAVQKPSPEKMGRLTFKTHMLLKAVDTKESPVNEKQVCIDIPTVQNPSSVEVNQVASEAHLLVKVEDNKRLFANDNRAYIDLPTTIKKPSSAVLKQKAFETQLLLKTADTKDSSLVECTNYPTAVQKDTSEEINQLDFKTHLVKDEPSANDKQAFIDFPTIQKPNSAELNKLTTVANLMVKAEPSEELSVNETQLCIDMPAFQNRTPLVFNQLDFETCLLLKDEFKDSVDEKPACINLPTLQKPTLAVFNQFAAEAHLLAKDDPKESLVNEKQACIDSNDGNSNLMYEKNQNVLHSPCSKLELNIQPELSSACSSHESSLDISTDKSAIVCDEIADIQKKLHSFHTENILVLKSRNRKPEKRRKRVKLKFDLCLLDDQTVGVNLCKSDEEQAECTTKIEQDIKTEMTVENSPTSISQEHCTDRCETDIEVAKYNNISESEDTSSEDIKEEWKEGSGPKLNTVAAEAQIEVNMINTESSEGSSLTESPNLFGQSVLVSPESSFIPTHKFQSIDSLTSSFAIACGRPNSMLKPNDTSLPHDSLMKEISMRARARLDCILGTTDISQDALFDAVIPTTTVTTNSCAETTHETTVDVNQTSRLFARPSTNDPRLNVAPAISKKKLSLTEYRARKKYDPGRSDSISPPACGGNNFVPVADDSEQLMFTPSPTLVERELENPQRISEIEDISCINSEKVVNEK